MSNKKTHQPMILTNQNILKHALYETFIIQIQTK